jgi:hypothetical protein
MLQIGMNIVYCGTNQTHDVEGGRIPLNALSCPEYALTLLITVQAKRLHIKGDSLSCQLKLSVGGG